MPATSPPSGTGKNCPWPDRLPLGLAPDAAYDELVFALHEGETLTFYTDGILEARNSAGELYGFERLAALVRSDPTIEQMVEEARNFGQQDDITIFRVTRLASVRTRARRQVEPGDTNRGGLSP